MKKRREAVFADLKQRTREWNSISRRLNDKRVSFIDINYLEQKCEKIIRAYKLATKLSYSKTKQSQLEAKKRDFCIILASIWHRYIELYNRQFHQDVCLCDVGVYLHESKKQPGLIETSVHRFIATRFAPKHPKDEYRKARRTRRHFTIFAGETNFAALWGFILTITKCRQKKSIPQVKFIEF